MDRYMASSARQHDVSRLLMKMATSIGDAEDGMGVVYDSEDTEAGLPVAFTLTKSQAMDLAEMLSEGNRAVINDRELRQISV